MHETRARLHVPNGIHSCDRRAYKLGLELKTASGYEGVHRAFVTGCPREVGNFIDRDKKTGAVHFVREPTRKGRSEPRQAADKVRFEKVQMIRPAKMAQIPNHLSASR